MQYHQCTTFEEELAQILFFLHFVCDHGRLSLLQSSVNTNQVTRDVGEEHAKQDNGFLLYTNQ